MSNMLKILQGFDAVEKKTITESAIAECGMTETPTQAPGSINITGDVASMAAMLKLMSGANSGAELLAPVAGSFQDDPEIPGRDDIEGDADLQAGFLGSVGGALAGGALGGPLGAIGGGIAGGAAQDAVTNKLSAGGNDNPDIPGRDDVEGDQDLDAGFMGGLGGALAGGALGGPAGAIGGGIAGSAAQDAVKNKVDAIGKESEEYNASTEPDEKYADQEMMSQMSGGINGKKKMYKPAAKGDNPMAVESDDNYVGAVEYHDGTTIYPKIGDTVELFYSDYTDSDDEADHKPNAVGKIVGKGKRDDETFIIKWKDNTTGNIEQGEFSAADEFYILNKDRSDPSRIKGRKQGELPMPGGKTTRRNVRNPAGNEDMAVETGNEDDRNELTKKLFPRYSREEWEKRQNDRNRARTQKQYMKPGKPSRSREWGAYESADEMRESMKARLLQSLEEKKAKPDFLDVDKDGDKKEPMKKAIADKKKGAVKEAVTESADIARMKQFLQRLNG